MTEFGDHDDADVYNVDGEPDPFQLAKHFHGVRHYLETNAGREFPHWDHVPHTEREVAEAMFAELIAWLQSENTL